MKKKKVGTLIISCLLVFITVFIVTACDEIEPIDNNNIGNVINGGERPDYDSMFDYESGYKPTEVSDISTLTIQSDKVAFADGSNAVVLNRTDPMPEVINNNTGTDIAGWYDVAKESSFWRQSSVMLRDKGSGSTGVEVTQFTMPGKDTTVAPFFVEEGKRPLIPATGNGIDTISAGCTATRETKFFETDIGTQIGAEFNYSGTPYTGSNSGLIPTGHSGVLRFVSSCAEANNSTTTGALLPGDHTFYFWFKNLGDETIKFTAYQVISGLNLISGKNSGEITLETGDTWSGSITVTLTGTNNNALTIITLGQEQTAAKLAMVLSKSPENEVA